MHHRRKPSTGSRAKKHSVVASNKQYSPYREMDQNISKMTGASKILRSPAKIRIEASVKNQPNRSMHSASDEGDEKN